MLFREYLPAILSDDDRMVHRHQTERSSDATTNTASALAFGVEAMQISNDLMNMGQAEPAEEKDVS